MHANKKPVCFRKDKLKKNQGVSEGEITIQGSQSAQWDRRGRINDEDGTGGRGWILESLACHFKELGFIQVSTFSVKSMTLAAVREYIWEKSRG